MDDKIRKIVREELYLIKQQEQQKKERDKMLQKKKTIDELYKFIKRMLIYHLVLASIFGIISLIADDDILKVATCIMLFLVIIFSFTFLLVKITLKGDKVKSKSIEELTDDDIDRIKKY